MKYVTSHTVQSSNTTSRYTLRETLDTCTTRNMNNILFSTLTIAKLKPRKYPGAHHQKSG